MGVVLACDAEPENSKLKFLFDVAPASACLTPELLRLFIEKIMVHEKEVKWSKHAPQTVEIYYNGIGYVGSGQQDVEEALEAPQTQDTAEPRQAS